VEWDARRMRMEGGGRTKPESIDVALKVSEKRGRRGKMSRRRS